MMVVASMAGQDGAVTSEEVFAVRQLSLHYLLGPDARGRVMAAAAIPPENLDGILERLSGTNLRYSLLLDLAGMAAVSGRDFQLLIGRDVLRRLVLEADFPLRRARFLAPGVFRPAHDSIAIPLKVEGGAPLARVQIEATVPVDLLIDTGATGDLALSDAAARRAGLTAPGRLVRQGHSISLSGLNPARTAIAATVRLGELSLRNIDVQIYAPAASAPGPVGLVGAGLLRPFRIALDLNGGRLWLTPAPLRVVPPP